MISLQQVSKTFGEFQAVTDISLEINRGEIFGMIGTSGAGKSTVLRLMNLLEVPTAGEVIVDGQSLTKASVKQLRASRKSIGMIFQHFHLLGNKTIYANIAVALELAGVPKREQATRVVEVLQYVGLSEYATSYPAALSGGQKQRIAIARALVTNPKVLLCDEPTSALDSNTTRDLLHVLQKINADFGVTIVLVSHELDVIKSICQRVAVLDQGRVYEMVDMTPKGIEPVDRTPASFVRALKEDA